MNFSFQRFYYIFKARNREFYRDLGALGWVFLFPFLMVISFSYIFNLDQDVFYKVGYLGSTPPYTSELTQLLPCENLKKCQEKLHHHKIDLLINKTENAFKVYTHEGSLKSKTALKILIGETATQKADITIEEFKGRKIRYVDWLFPGLLSFNMVWMAFWGVGWVIVRHRKLGILKRLKSSPVTALEYLLAQMTSRLILLIGTGIIIFAGSYMINPFPIIGNLFELLILYTLGCFCHCAIGMVLAARIQSEELANGIINLMTYPMIFISEIWFSLEGSSLWLKNVAALTPLWHMTDGMRKILYEGTSLSDLPSSIILFISVTIISLIIGSITFRWHPAS